MAKVADDPDLRSLTVTLPDATVLKLEGNEPFELVATPGVNDRDAGDGQRI